jgi:2-polyprenyl-6-methoxyphenol hydroxylase-like FAD-dependent oxidoreductase
MAGWTQAFLSRHPALPPDMTHDLLDVLVVGYGPVGQLLSLKLAQAGLRVGVVERWSTLFHAPRAVHYDHEIARIFQGAGVGDAMAAISDEPDAAELISGKGELLLSQHWDGPGESGWPRANGFAQPELEAILHAAVERQPTAELWRGWKAEGLAQGPDHVALTVCRCDGTEDAAAGDPGAERTMLRARWLVGCDGANSQVREWLGIPTTDLGFHYDWLVVNLRWKPGFEGSFGGLRQTLYPGRPTTMTPAGRHRRRWEFMLMPGEDRQRMAEEATAWTLLEPFGVTPEMAVLERHAVYTFQARWADHWRVGRCLIAGDAAHLMPPFMAQGMCSGIRDAASLAWRLPMVLRHMAPPTLLDSYTTERLPHVKHLIRGSVANGRIFCMTHPIGWRLRDAVVRLASRFPKLGPQPPSPGPLGPGMLRDDDPQAGHLSFQGRVQAIGRDGRFDDVVGGGFVLTGLGFDPAAHLSDANRRWFSELGGVIAHIGPDGPVQDVDGGYAGAFARRGIVACLTRPDFYQFGTARVPAEVNDIVDALRRKLAA